MRMKRARGFFIVRPLRGFRSIRSGPPGPPNALEVAGPRNQSRLLSDAQSPKARRSVSRDLANMIPVGHWRSPSLPHPDGSCRSGPLAHPGPAESLDHPAKRGRLEPVQRHTAPKRVPLRPCHPGRCQILPGSNGRRAAKAAKRPAEWRERTRRLPTHSLKFPAFGLSAVAKAGRPGYNPAVDPGEGLPGSTHQPCLLSTCMFILSIRCSMG